MKKYHSYSLVFVLIMSLFACNALPTQEQLASMSLEERWSYLAEGQSLEEVHHLLGQPIKTVQQGTVQLEQYDCALCFTKVSKHNGLLAWNAPVKGFEEEAQLIYIGEPSILEKASSMIPSNSEIAITGQEMKESLNELFQEVENQLTGEEGKEWRDALEENAKKGLEELERFLTEDIGEHADEILQLQKELLSKNWEGNKEEMIRLWKELRQELKKLEDIDKIEEFSPFIESNEKEVPTSRAEQWMAIEEGMTEEEVVKLLGDPKYKERWGGNTTYTYECHLCTVTFNNSGRVWNWHSPKL